MHAGCATDCNMKSFLLYISILLFSCCFIQQAWAQSNQTLSNGETTAPVNFPGTGCTYLWVNNAPGIGLPASGIGNISPFTVINNGSTPVKATITATPEPTGFAYIANYGDGTVSVINTASNSVVSTIPVQAQLIGIGVNTNFDRMVVANSGANTMEVVNTVNNGVTQDLPVGSAPYGVLESPDGLREYVANSGSGNVSVFNAVTSALIATVLVGNKPQGLAISPDGTRLYVTNTGSATISVINTVVNEVTATINLSISPFGITISADGKMIYVTDNGSPGVVVAISTESNSVVSTIPVGKNPAGITVKADNSVVYVANSGSNNVSVISTTSVVNTKSNSVVTTIPVSESPFGLAVSPDGSFLCVANAGSDDVSIINTATNAVTASITVGSQPDSFGNFLTANVSGCEGQPLTFTITVNPSQAQVTKQFLSMPNTFTPNGDGINDTWNVKALSFYVNCSVDIFDRWGNRVFSSIGYTVPWDGTYKGTALPPGTYYYIIKLNNGLDPLSGFVTIIR